MTVNIYRKIPDAVWAKRYEVDADAMEIIEFFKGKGKTAYVRRDLYLNPTRNLDTIVISDGDMADWEICVGAWAVYSRDLGIVILSDDYFHRMFEIDKYDVDVIV